MADRCERCDREECPVGPTKADYDAAYHDPECKADVSGAFKSYSAAQSFCLLNFENVNWRARALAAEARPMTEALAMRLALATRFALPDGRSIELRHDGTWNLWDGPPWEQPRNKIGAPLNGPDVTAYLDAALAASVKP